jgi:hypothetical protein
MACEKVKMESIDGQMEGVRRMLCLGTNQGDYSLLTFKDYGRESRSYTSPMFSKRDDLCLMVNNGGSSNFELSSILLLRPPSFYKTPADVKSLAFR